MSKCLVRKFIIQDLVFSVELHLGLIPHALSLIPTPCSLSSSTVPFKPRHIWNNVKIFGSKMYHTRLHLGLIPYALSLGPCPLSLLLVPYHIVLFLSRNIGGGSCHCDWQKHWAPTLCIPNLGTDPTLLFIRIIRLKSWNNNLVSVCGNNDFCLPTPPPFPPNLCKYSHMCA